MPREVKALVDAIGHDMRTEILHKLSLAPATVADLVAVLPTDQSQIRRHLAMLEAQGLVTATATSEERRGGGRGNTVLWRTNVTRAEEVARIWSDYVTGKTPGRHQ